MFLYIYIMRERERERECVHAGTCLHVHACIFFISVKLTNTVFSSSLLYAQRLERGENMEDEDLFGQGTGEARDSVSLLPKKIAVQVNYSSCQLPAGSRSQHCHPFMHCLMER